MGTSSSEGEEAEGADGGHRPGAFAAKRLGSPGVLAARGSRSLAPWGCHPLPREADGHDGPSIGEQVRGRPRRDRPHSGKQRERAFHAGEGTSHRLPAQQPLQDLLRTASGHGHRLATQTHRDGPQLLPRCISRPRITSGRLLLGMMLTINMPVMCVAPRPRAARPKLLSHRPGAWTRSTSEDADRLGSAGATRLLIHSVNDIKTIGMYLNCPAFCETPPAPCDFSRNPTRMGSGACQLYGWFVLPQRRKM